jgi:two-component system sensor histidine kinase RegB
VEIVILSHSKSLPALNLRRLLLVRAGAVAGWLLMLGFLAWHLELRLLYTGMLALLAIWVVVSAAIWLYWRRREEVADAVFFAQLLFDIAILTALLYLSGGSTNPFTLLLLLPLVVSAAMLPGSYSWMLAGATVLCYTLLLYSYIPLPGVEHHGVGHEAGSDFDLHVIGMWLGFVLSAALIAGFVGRMGSTLRERDRLLADSQQRALRDERIVALGALAAGAAHELGTPLGTIALLGEEIESEHAQSDPELAEKLRVLRTQVERCKHTLAMLSLSAGQSQAASGQRLAIDDYLQATVARWRELRSGAQASCDLQGTQPAPVIVAEQTLSQAILSIFNNAADAAHDRVEISARWTRDSLRLEVRDNGRGLAPAALSAAGKAVFSTKRPGEGLGLGLYLAYAVIGRLGGEILLFNREEGGACTRMTLPLAQLLVPGEGGNGG